MGASTELRERTRRIGISSATIVGAVALGLTAGALFSQPGSTKALALPALALQTLLTVGALPRRERSASPRPGLVLLALHHALASVPLALVALAIGLGDPLGLGLFLIAAAPPAALTPAYADVAEVPGRDLLVFVLVGYALALGLTPALVYLAAGEVAGLGTIATTLGVGLIGPAILARVLHRAIARIPQRVRRGVVNASIVTICFGLGGGLPDGLASDAVRPWLLVVVVAALALRSTLGALAAERVAPRALRVEAPFAVPFKNVALAAAVGGSLAGAAASLPGLLGFGVESLAFLWLARRTARAGGSGAPRRGRPRHRLRAPADGGR